MFVPAIKACRLEPKRVDRDNLGGILNSEIMDFITKADIVLADLTYERPNCYLEVGYTIGVGKLRNLILSAKEDHNQDHPSHKNGGPKAHFDLAGYDVLFWSPEKSDVARNELTNRIQRRLAINAGRRDVFVPSWNDEWVKRSKGKALEGLHAMERRGYMELRFALQSPKPDLHQVLLLSAMTKAQILTFGWSIGVAFDSRTSEWAPSPSSEGVAAEISSSGFGGSYDYWALKRDGDFFLPCGLFEDTQRENRRFIDTRINRVTEALLFCVWLYNELGVSTDVVVNMAVGHGG
ncbi:MAG TPA: hypothetical protein DDZ66_05415 [Firmicutes bacterium]|nr:hypothetical protein [Bacillota bacterium]